MQKITKMDSSKKSVKVHIMKRAAAGVQGSAGCIRSSTALLRQEDKRLNVFFTGPYMVTLT